MVPPRRRTPDEEELPELPPIDGDETSEPGDIDNDLDEISDDETSLDDVASDDLAIDEIDAPEDSDGARDDTDGPVDPGDEAEEIDGDDGLKWTGDDAREDADDADLDEVEAPVAEDQGAEGPEGDATDELEALPPLDDDADGDRTVGDEGHELPELPAFGLPVRQGVSARLLLVGEALVSVLASTGVSVGRDRVYAAGESLMSLPIASLDDAGAVFETMHGVDVDELFSSVIEDASGALWIGAHSGAVWRKARARDPWRRVATLSDGRSTGAVELLRDGRRVWALPALGSLHRCDEGQRFEETLPSDHVRLVAVDPAGTVLAALSGRRVDALRASADGGHTWSSLRLPEEVTAGCVARASDVCVVGQSSLGAQGYVSIDGGASWVAWPILAGATALAVVEADDGDARVLFTAHDDATDGAVLASARVGAKGEPVAACMLTDLAAVLPRSDHDDEEAAHRVERVVVLDRAGRHVALVTHRGAVVLVSVAAEVG